MLELPRAASRATVARAGDDEAASSRAAYRQRLVHYVEDNETNVEVMRGILALRPQVELEVSALGLDGLAAIRQRRPSLILLDMHLPDIDGLELLRHLQADADTADIPVIVVSADATEARIVAGDRRRRDALPDQAGQRAAASWRRWTSVLDQLDTHFG